MALPRRHQVLNNQTLAASGNIGANLPNLGQSATPMLIAVLDIQGTVSGATPTLTVNIYSAITGNRPALLGSFTETAALAHPVRLALENVLEEQVYVDWQVSSGASFAGVYLDLIFPSPDA